MPATFDRDSMAAFYARRYKETDPGVAAIHYLPTGVPGDEIRFVEINASIVGDAHPEPIDFGVDGGTDQAHRLIVLDVTPRQWEAIRKGTLALPPGWTLEGSQAIGSGRMRRR